MEMAITLATPKAATAGRENAMGMNKILYASFLFTALCVAAPSYAGGPFNVTATTVLTESGKDLVLHPDNNPIDQQTQMNCISAAGCSMIIQSKMYFEGNAKNERTTWYCIRSFVDGNEANPPCEKHEFRNVQNVAEDGSLQTLDVQQGSHTVQTDFFAKKFFDDRPYGGRIFTWTITYTMYDH